MSGCGCSVYSCAENYTVTNYKSENYTNTSDAPENYPVTNYTPDAQIIHSMKIKFSLFSGKRIRSTRKASEILPGCIISDGDQLGSGQPCEHLNIRAVKCS